MRNITSKLLGLLLAASLTGCGVVRAFTAPPPSFTYAVHNQAADVDDTASTCTSPIVETPLETWQQFFSDGSSRTLNIYWYAPSGQTGNLYIYTGQLDGTSYSQPTSDAIASWYAALKSRVPAGHYLRLAPAQDALNWSADLVQMTIDSSGTDFTRFAFTSYGTVYAPGAITQPNGNEATSDGTFIAGALVTFLSAPINEYGYEANSSFLYRLSLHELGHALGLNHNPEHSSIMYQFAAQTSCYDYGELPIAADTNALERVYDPMINADETRPTPPPPTNCNSTSSAKRDDSSNRRISGIITPICPASVTRHITIAPPQRPSQSQISSPRIPRWLNRPNVSAASTNRPTAKRASVETFMRSLRWIHGESDGTVDFRKLSAASLVAASSSVVQAHLIRNIANARRGPTPIVVTHEYAIDAVVDDVAAAIGDRPMIVGDHVFVDEVMAYEDVPFADDPTPTGEATLFLRKVVGPRARRAGLHVAYQLTSPLIANGSRQVMVASFSRDRRIRALLGKSMARA